MDFFKTGVCSWGKGLILLKISQFLKGQSLGKLTAYFFCFNFGYRCLCTQSTVTRLSRHTTSFMGIFQILLYKGNFSISIGSTLFGYHNRCSSGALVSEKESHSRSPIRFRSILSFQVCCDIYSYTIYIVTFELVEYFPECDLLPLSTTISKNLQINFFNFLLHNFHSLIKCCPDAFDF